MNEQHKKTAAHAGSGVHRRTVVKGAAWSIPVIAAAVAVPAHAASVPVQTQCMDDTNTTWGGSTTAVTQPYATTTSSQNPGYNLYQFQQGQSYEITVTTTITYNGVLPVSIAGLMFEIQGTRWIDWTLTGTPTITSTRGNITLGSATDAAPGQVAPQRTATTDLTPIATDASDPYIHPGDTITITWNLIAHGPSSPIGAAGSGYAYPIATLTCNGAWTSWHPAQFDGSGNHVGNLYQYVL